LKRRWFFISFLLIVLVAALGVYIDWTWKRKLSPRGGRYFFHRVELTVPSFRQADEKWSDDPLGGVEENGTLGGEGCAVAATAMVFKFYGIETDPQQLNWFLTSVGGYTEQGWLYWDRAAWFAPDHVRHVYEDLASYQLIDSNIAHGNPVIVRVRPLRKSRGETGGRHGDEGESGYEERSEEGKAYRYELHERGRRRGRTARQGWRTRL